jgi:hypothetical protein
MLVGEMTENEMVVYNVSARQLVTTIKKARANHLVINAISRQLLTLFGFMGLIHFGDNHELYGVWKALKLRQVGGGTDLLRTEIVSRLLVASIVC